MRQEKDLVDDLLMSEKQLAGLFTTATTEASTPNVRNGFKSVLTCQLDIQDEVYQAMSNRGWYQMENAEQQKVEQAKTKFASKPMNS